MSNLNRPKRGYTVLQNKLLRDERLSWKARGIFTYLWSQSSDWNFYVTEVVNHATDGKDSLLSGLRELEKYGYLTRQRLRDDQGQLRGAEWNINDNPAESLPIEENPQEVKPPLRTTNNKNYQQQEVPTKETHSTASAAPLPWRQVLDYLNEKAGKHYRHTNANKSLIEPRLKEGFSLDDCKRVIDNKVRSWSNDPFMSKYLRPKTLFQASKFDGYLNETVPAREEHDGYGGVNF